MQENILALCDVSVKCEYVLASFQSISIVYPNNNLTVAFFCLTLRSGHPCKLLPFGFPYDLTGLGSISEPNQLRIILGSKPNNAFIYLSIFIGIYVIIFAIFLGIALSRSNLVHHHHHSSSSRKGHRSRRRKRKPCKQLVVNFDESKEDTRTDLTRLQRDLSFV